MKTQRVVAPDQNKSMINRRSTPRYDFFLQGSLLPHEGTIDLDINNVSLSGFRAHVAQIVKVPFGAKIPARVSIDSSKESNLIVTAVWKDDEGNFGFRIDQSDPTWLAFIKTFEGRK